MLLVGNGPPTDRQADRQAGAMGPWLVVAVVVVAAVVVVVLLLWCCAVVWCGIRNKLVSKKAKQTNKTLAPGSEFPTTRTPP